MTDIDGISGKNIERVGEFKSEKLEDIMDKFEDVIKYLENSEKNIEIKEPIQNKKDGLERERIVEKELKDKYSETDSKIESEVYLRDSDGNIVRDNKTGEARRLDYVVIEEGKVVDSIEVTSKTADKTEQSAKEDRIREQGGDYIKDSEGNLVEIPKDIKTRIERRD